MLNPILRCAGQKLGIKEHCCFQAAGTAAGGLGGGLVAPVLVLFWNGYFTSPSDDAWRLLLLMFGAAGFGLIFGICLRRFMVIKQNLVFPDGTAAAEVLLTMYRSQASAKAGQKRVRVMLISFAISFVLGFVFYFFPVFQSYPIFWFMSNCGLGKYTTCAKIPEVYTYWMTAHFFGWSLLFDPVFVASAFLVGPAVNIWMFIGALFSFGFVAPILQSLGVYKEVPSFGYARDQTFLIPAAITLLVSSFSAILFNPKMFEGMCTGISIGNPSHWAQNLRQAIKDDKEKNVPEVERDTPWFIWVPLMVLSIALAIAVYLGLFGDDIRTWEMFVALILTFPIAFVCVQIQGKSNWGMGAAIGKLVMIIIGAAGATGNSMLLLGNMVSQASSQTGEITQCYKTGYLVGASPHAQFLAQLVGTVFGGISSLGAFLLYTKAYPCMLDPNDEKCIFPMGAARAWMKLAALLEDGLTIGNKPTDSMNYVGLYLTIGFPILVIVIQCLESFVLPKRFHKFLPVWTVFFLAFLIPPEYPVAMLLGQGIHSMWKVAFPASCKSYTYPVAAGLISGGCIATIFTAIMSVFDVNSLAWGSSLKQA